jgi:uncharacterized zinc-type alcohol dehydrogenase-like protein
MGVQFSARMGHETFALSTSPDKEDAARAMGAKGFINTKDASALEAHASSFDMILVTVTAELDWTPYFKLLRARGVLAFVGAAPGAVSAPVVPELIMKGIRVTGSAIGGVPRMREMLRFAATHGVKAQVEVTGFDPDSVNAAVQRVRDNKARFRMVLKH